MKFSIKSLLLFSILLSSPLFLTACGSSDSTQNSGEHRAGIVLEEFLYKETEFPQCHSASLIELEGGELLATFFGGTRERHPDVEIRIARKKPGEEWTEPVSVADGVQPDGTRLPTWNPVLFQPEGGDLMLFYKIGPHPSKWWGMVKTSTDGGHTWSEAEKLGEDLIGPVKNKPIQLEDGSIIAGSSTEGDGWKVHVERSTDGGNSWDIIGPLNDPENVDAIQPTLLTYPNGDIQMLSRTHHEKGGYIYETWSKDGGLTWSNMEPTVLPNNNSGIDGVTLEDGRQILVYNHSTRTQPKMGHKGRGIINVAVSEDGKKWEAALALDYLDESGKQFSYPAIIQTSDGLVHILYTWHRVRIKHIVIDPDKLETFPIEEGEWPTNKIPFITSTEK